MLFDPEKSDNETKVNTYILESFGGNYDRPIATNLIPYITRTNLVDMLVLDRSEFEKNISTSVKKKDKN
jgi:hypothetical protein